MYIPRWTIVLASLATMTSITDVGVLGTPDILPCKLVPLLRLRKFKPLSPITPSRFGILAATKELLWQAHNAQKLVGIIPSDLSLHGYPKAGTKNTFTVIGGSPCGQTKCKGVIEREGGPSVITEGAGYVIATVNAEKMEQMIKDGISTHKADLDYRVTVEKQNSSP
ncbi:hypothetical protein EV360DRAFT_68434 [Lentinula raphanica]|nr:hypothetical protein EV360DRAFT_68434 [Lentinula raphanica]